MGKPRFVGKRERRSTQALCGLTLEAKIFCVRLYNADTLANLRVEHADLDPDRVDHVVKLMGVIVVCNSIIHDQLSHIYVEPSRDYMFTTLLESMFSLCFSTSETSGLCLFPVKIRSGVVLTSTAH